MVAATGITADAYELVSRYDGVFYNKKWGLRDMTCGPLAFPPTGTLRP